MYLFNGYRIMFRLRCGKKGFSHNFVSSKEKASQGLISASGLDQFLEILLWINLINKIICTTPHF